MILQYQVEGAGEDSAEELQEFPRGELIYWIRNAGKLQQQQELLSADTVQEECIAAL